MNSTLRNEYPLNTFTGTTQDELVAFVERKQLEAELSGRVKELKSITKKHFTKKVIFDEELFVATAIGLHRRTQKLEAKLIRELKEEK